MHEDIALTAVGGDETETFLRVEELHCTTAMLLSNASRSKRDLLLPAEVPGIGHEGRGIRLRHLPPGVNKWALRSTGSAPGSGLGAEGIHPKARAIGQFEVAEVEARGHHAAHQRPGPLPHHPAREPMPIGTTNCITWPADTSRPMMISWCSPAGVRMCSSGIAIVEVPQLVRRMRWKALKLPAVSRKRMLVQQARVPSIPAPGLTSNGLGRSRGKAPFRMGLQLQPLDQQLDRVPGHQSRTN